MVYKALERNGPECNNAMSEAIRFVEDMVDDPNQWEELDGMYSIQHKFLISHVLRKSLICRYEIFDKIMFCSSVLISLAKHLT